MGYRGHDNFTDPYDYIINQLFIYDYTDTTDFNKLKMKIWVLDGIIRDEETVTDTDVDNPVRHFDWLQNELTFLDRYVRTQDDTLAVDEKDFDELVADRITQKQAFISRINPNTGTYYHDYDQSYSARPTLLTTSQFSTLYTAYKTKETAGELSTAFEITSAVTTYCIDDEAREAERAVQNHVTAAEIEVLLATNASNNKDKNDYNFVTEMNRCYDEMWTIVKSVSSDPADAFGAWSGPGTNYTEGDFVSNGGNVYECNTTHVSGATFAGDAANWDLTTVETGVMLFPHRREQVSLTPGDSSHKGTIQAGEGYRFLYYKSPDDDSWLTTWPSPDDADVCDVPAAYTGEYNTDEDTVENFIYVMYYTDAAADEHIETLGITISSLPNGGDDPGDLTRERFDELNNRWVTINNLREYAISNTGTRIMIETMVNASITDLLADKEQHFTDVKNEKIYYTGVLQEICVEFT